MQDDGTEKEVDRAGDAAIKTPAKNSLAGVALPAGTLGWSAGARSARLRELSTLEVAGDLLARLREGNGLGEGSQGVMLGVKLQMELEDKLDVHENRFGRKRLANSFWNRYRRFRGLMPSLQGATVLDIGCGGIHPLGLSLAFLALGAKRVFGVDLDSVHDVRQAAKGLARTAAMLLINPRYVFADYPITRAEILQNLSCLDLAKLADGDIGGLDRDRIWFLQESVHNLSLGDNSVDIIASSAFLEHVPELDKAIAELARITRPGGVHAHVVDLRDHRHYNDPKVHPLAFLSEPMGPELVFGCNRERAGGFRRRFEEAGLEVIEHTLECPMAVGDELRSTFVEPFRSMPIEELGGLSLVTAQRKRA
ncbi:MAG: class I SAM-dependent methyltransferase [Planctomycetes bacterium]|jgi:SAM-dependent methyltransferase|nr:class I SAM-dependent methyltransferase [Planctomycetota bacterium]MCC7063344.1 class I SAM-dependent methyltransferase [Planctomycetota bacterium]